MGRRARTNCSPIDSAMEKYHNDIGHRLSGVFIPPIPTALDGEPLSKDFCMLTLDTRHLSSLKNKTTHSKTRHSHPDNASDVPSSTADASSTTPSRLTTHTSPHSEQDLVKDKKRLVDKLTRALFQKKHMCARCKRRSRSCIPNKTFGSTDKHYTCVRCRESSHALKNLFCGKSNSNDSELSDSGAVQASSSLLTSQCKDRTIPVPRIHLNDSGYETVTSCSTVASAYSAFKSSGNIASKAGTEKSASQNPMLYTDQESSYNRVTDTPKLAGSNTTDKTRLHAQCVCSDLDTTPEQNSSTELYHFLGLDQHNGLPAGILRQVVHKNVKDYDGYLPDVESHEWRCNKHTALANAINNVEEPSEDEDDDEFSDIFPRVINISKPVEKSSSNSTEKACYTCRSTSKPCFRLPWEGGWICEDCLDGLY